MIAIKQEPFETNILSFLELAEPHYDEAWPYSYRAKVDVDLDTLLILERRGNLLFVAVKDGLKLVGYYVGVLNYCIFSKAVLVCTTAFFYLDKKHRKGWGTIKLFKSVEKILRSKKVMQWDISYTTKKNLAPIMKRIGAEEQEIVCRKWLGD